MARLSGKAKLVVGALVLAVVTALLILAVSVFTGRVDKSGYAAPLSAGSVPLATVPSQESCQTTRSFDCFLVNANDTALLPQNHLSSSYDLVQTAGDYSIHLRWGYADGKRIEVAVEIDSPKEYNFMAILPRLSDKNGHEFNAMMGGGGIFDKGKTGMIFTYGGSNLNSDDGEILVKLEIPALIPWSAPDALAPVTPTPGPPPIPPPDRVNGPFVFQMRLPVIPVQTVEPHQTVQTTDFGELTLERVIITPVEIQAFVRGAPNNATFEASVNGWTSASEPGGGWRSTGKQPDGTTQIVIGVSPPADKRAGLWTLTLRQSAFIQAGPDIPSTATAGPALTATIAPASSFQAKQTTAAPAIPPVEGEFTASVPPGPLPIFATFQFAVP